MTLGKIVHLGIVVEDLDKAVKIYEENLGIGPWEMMDSREFFDIMTVEDGKKLNILGARYHGDGYEIELIMPVGEGVYADWLREKGPGLHHVKFETENSVESVVERCSEISGRRPYLEVKWPDGRPLFAYADLLHEAGLLLEVTAESDAE